MRADAPSPAASSHAPFWTLSEPCSSRFGPAALLIWWVLAFGVWLGHVTTAEHKSVSDIVSSWKSAVVLLALLAMAVSLLTLNGLLLHKPQRLGMKMVFFMVCTMLCLARATPRMLAAMNFQASEHSTWLLLDRHLCQGPLPLLYVLLICELPADPAAAIGVALLYVIVSAVVAVRGPLPESLPDQVEPWIDATLLLGFATMAVLRRQIPVRTVKSAASLVAGDVKHLAWKQAFGPATLLFWWLIIVYSFCDMLQSSAAWSTEALSDDHRVHIETFAAGGMTALVCVLCTVTLALVLLPRKIETLQIEVPIVVAMLLFSGGVHLGRPWLPEMPSSMDLFASLQTGPLPIAHVLMISRVPCEACGVLQVAASYIVLEGANQVVAANRSGKPMISGAVAEWFVTVACAGLAAVRSCCPACPLKLLPVAAPAVSDTPPPATTTASGLHELPQRPGLGQDGWLLPPMPAGRVDADSDTADVDASLAAGSADAARAAASAALAADSTSERLTAARAAALAAVGDDVAFPRLAAARAAALAAVAAATGRPLSSPRLSPRRSPRGRAPVTRVVPEEPGALLPTTYGLIHAGAIVKHVEPELEPDVQEQREITRPDGPPRAAEPIGLKLVAARRPDVNRGDMAADSESENSWSVAALAKTEPGRLRSRGDVAADSESEASCSVAALAKAEPSRLLVIPEDEAQGHRPQWAPAGSLHRIWHEKPIAEMPQLCPAGHRLHEFETPNDGFVCGRCEAHFPSGTNLYGCQECNYDVCRLCLTGKALPEVPAAISTGKTSDDNLADHPELGTDFWRVRRLLRGEAGDDVDLGCEGISCCHVGETDI